MISGIAGPARRVLAVVATLVAATASTVVLGPAIPAVASPVIDPGQPASLTIHRYVQPDDISGLVPGDGTEVIPPPALDPIPGVEYTVRGIQGIDLSTPGGWASAFALAGSFDPALAETSIADAGFSLGAARAATTGSDGIAAFSGLDIGMYLVAETSAPTGALGLPFIVLLPITDPRDASSWLYDVDVYPKLGAVETPLPPGFITKSVDSALGHRVGDRIEWLVVGEILDGGDVLWWRTTDWFDPRLEFVEARVRLLDGAVVTEGVDYEVVYDPAEHSARVEFLGPPGANGLKVITDHAATQVEIVFVTKVVDAATILNEAVINTSIWDDPVGVVEYVAGASAPAAVIVDPPENLAWTGFANLPWAMLGAGLVTGGYFLLVLAKLRRRGDREAMA